MHYYKYLIIYLKFKIGYIFKINIIKIIYNIFIIYEKYKSRYIFKIPS